MPFRKNPDTLQILDDQLKATDTPDETKRQVSERIEKLEALKAKSQTTEEKARDELKFHPELKKRIEQTQAQIQAQINQLRTLLYEFDQVDKEVDKQTRLQTTPLDIDNNKEIQTEIKLIERTREIQDIGEKIATMIAANNKKGLLEFLNDKKQWTKIDEYTNNQKLQEAMSQEVGPGKRWCILIKDYDTNPCFILVPNENKNEIESIFLEILQEKSETNKTLTFESLESLRKRQIENEFQKTFKEVLDEMSILTDGFEMSFLRRESKFSVLMKKNKIKIIIYIYTTFMRMQAEVELLMRRELTSLLKNAKISEKMEKKIHIPTKIKIRFK